MASVLRTKICRLVVKDLSNIHQKAFINGQPNQKSRPMPWVIWKMKWAYKYAKWFPNSKHNIRIKYMRHALRDHEHLKDLLPPPELESKSMSKKQLS